MATERRNGAESQAQLTQKEPKFQQKFLFHLSSDVLSMADSSVAPVVKTWLPTNQSFAFQNLGFQGAGCNSLYQNNHIFKYLIIIKSELSDGISF